MRKESCGGLKHGLVLVVSLASWLAFAVRPAVATNYWDWGAGVYDDANSDVMLDNARWDWTVECNVGLGASQAYWDMLNARMTVNTNLKAMFQVGQFYNMVNLPGRDHGCPTMLDYRYNSAIKAEVDQRLHDQIDMVLTNCAYPSRVIGFSIIEEEPVRWGGPSAISTNAQYTMPQIVQDFQTQIVQDTNLPSGCTNEYGVLQWNEPTKRFVGQMYAACMCSLHAIIKAEISAHSSSAKVVFWRHPCIFFLDDVPNIWGGSYPVSWTNILYSTNGIQMVDVITAHANATTREDQYLPVAKQYNIPFFWQLWHPSRLDSAQWAAQLSIVKTNTPLNLGYFFYCEGWCNDWVAQGQDYATGLDPSYGTDASLNQYSGSIVDHWRRFGAQENVGMDLVRKELAPFASLDVNWTNKAPGTVAPLTVLLENPATGDWFTNANLAMASGVVVTVTLPANCILDPGHAGQSLTNNVGNLAAQSWQKLVWWVRIESALANPVTRVKVSSSNRPTVTNQFTGDSSIPAFLARDIRRPVAKWMENAIGRLLPISPVLAIETLRNTDHPAFTDSVGTQVYNGELLPGQNLLISTNGMARMCNGELLQETQVSDSAPSDPTGYKPYTEGDLVDAVPEVYRVVTGLTNVKVTLSGMVADGGACVVKLQFWNWENASWPLLSWQTPLGTNWNTVSETFAVPAGAPMMLYSILFYRNGGVIYLGTIKVENVTYPPEGADVSSNIVGTLSDIPADGFKVITYSNLNYISDSPLVRVQFLHPTCELTVPAESSVYLAPANVTLTATAETGDSVSTISKVEFFRGTNAATKIGESTNAPYSIAWTNPPAGQHMLTAKVTDSHGATGVSRPVNITVWTTADINATSGSASYSNGVFTVAGRGAGITGTADGFRFVYLPMTGNCTVQARVYSVSGIYTNNGRAGVMIRETTNAGAKEVSALLAEYYSPDREYQHRRTVTGSTTTSSSYLTQSSPAWVKVVRNGTTFNAWRAPDSNGSPGTWSKIGADITGLSMSNTVQVGLALTSGNINITNTGTIDHVSITAP